ncbi:MAG: hypothetical protein K0U36_06220 [Alphaproteobacteria bacterium]|nr:hypothetical protein [Alphaproteobacteria bacterium]
MVDLVALPCAVMITFAAEERFTIVGVGGIAGICCQERRGLVLLGVSSSNVDCGATSLRDNLIAAIAGAVYRKSEETTLRAK